MSGPDEKGKFSTSIAQDLIDAAMKSVDKAHKEVTGEEPEVEVPIEAPAAPEATAEAAAEPAPEGEPAPEAPADKRDVELAEVRAQLDHSLEHGRNLMGKFKDEHERLLRATADLENYKKRAAREKEEQQKFGNEKLLKDFVPVYDNFDRALDAARTADDFDSLRKGVEMMKKLFEDTLGKHGVKVFSARGQPFDPNRHEAMSQEATDAVPPNHVAREVLKGFTLNERLIRPALVVVSAALPKPAEAPAAPAEETPEPAANAPEGDTGGPTES